MENVYYTLSLINILTDANFVIYLISQATISQKALLPFYSLAIKPKNKNYFFSYF